MQKSSVYLNRLRSFAKDNYILAIIGSIIVLVVFVALFKSITAKDETVYVRVKVSQGFWWANTLKPSIWMIPAFKKGDSEVSLTGKTLAEIQEVRYYPLSVYPSGEQYDIFMIVKLKATSNKKTGKYTFKRASIAVGSPIDFDFSKAQVSATVMDLSDRPFDEKLTEKIVTLRKTFASPWEAEGIKVGDTYHDGKEIVLTVLDKSTEPSFEDYSTFGNNYSVNTEKPVNVDATVRMKLSQRNSMFFYKEELPIQLGRRISIQSSNFFFDDFVVTQISN